MAKSLTNSDNPSSVAGGGLSRSRRHAWVPEDAFDLADGPFRVFAALTICADRDGLCWPGQAEIARLSKRGIRQVRYHLEWLEANGWLTVKKRRRDTALYRIKTGNGPPLKAALDRQPETQDRQVGDVKTGNSLHRVTPQEHPIYNTAAENPERRTKGLESCRTIIGRIAR